MTTLADRILSLYDAGQPVAAIALECGVSGRYVYRHLELHRPNRKRKARERKSKLRDEILLYARAGIERKRIAQLFADECRRQYVYRVVDESRRG
jgi:hypothetical protein